MTLTLKPELTRAEVDEICDPLTQGAAQCRYLRKIGVSFTLRPTGHPLVNRERYNIERGAALSAAPAVDGPRWSKP